MREVNPFEQVEARRSKAHKVWAWFIVNLSYYSQWVIGRHSRKITAWGARMSVVFWPDED